MILSKFSASGPRPTRQPPESLEGLLYDSCNLKEICFVSKICDKCLFSFNNKEYVYFEYLQILEVCGNYSSKIAQK